MDNRTIFERNLLALATADDELCKKLSSAVTTRGRYRFLPTREGETVPAGVDRSGTARPLHSLVDPRKEAFRVIATVKGGAMLIILGLGGGYAAEAALARDDIHGLLVIDFDADGVAELLAEKEYLSLFRDPRFRLLVDPKPADIEEALLDGYRPAFAGGISVLPLRPRTDLASEDFGRAADTVKATIERVSDDYSVQAYFGKRWFANAIRNLSLAENPTAPVPPARRVAVVAAGPSLDSQLPLLELARKDAYILATDTSLPALLQAGMKPDAVISIDCQHISYYHFMRGMPADIPLFLDLASPPAVAGRSPNPRFFSGGHPLTIYLARRWRSFPRIDTSGGNVTYAAVALADTLGAETIDLYGADFSYPFGEPYARGTYIHPYFQRRQNRLSPLESLFASFIFRNESLRLERSGNAWRYETKPLAGYRQRLERLAPTLRATIVPVKGPGAPIAFPLKGGGRKGHIPMLASGRASSSARTFLSEYARRLRELPPIRESLASYLSLLDDERSDILTTILPTAAAIRRELPEASPARLLEAVRGYCLTELDAVLAASLMD